MYHTPRRDPRHKLLIRAGLRLGGPPREACVLDVSSRGLSATTASPPPRGAFVELLLAGRSLVGQVEWSGERRFGVTLRERLDVAALLADTSPISPARRFGRTPARAQPVTAPPPAPANDADDSAEAARGLGHRLQFAAMVLAGFLGALAVWQAVSTQLSVLHRAGVAMAEARGR